MSLTELSEVLIARVVQHDRGAFAILYDRHVRAVYAIALRMIGKVDAEEVVQDVYLRLWQRAYQFDPRRGSFQAWFMTIARHRVLDELNERNRSQREEALEEVEDFDENKRTRIWHCHLSI